MLFQSSTCPSRPQGLLTGCALALAIWAGSAHAADPNDYFPAPAFITLQASSALETLPTKTTWDKLTAAHYDAISHDGSRMLVSSKNKPLVYLLNAKDGSKLASIEVGPVPQGVGISPDGHWGLAVSAGSGTVTVINMQTYQRVKSIAVGKVPHNIRFNASGNRAYVTLQGEASVAVLNMETLKKIDAIPVPGLIAPHNLDLSADGNTLWVRGLVGKVAAVDIPSHKVLAIIPVGSGHAGIDVIPGGRYVFTGGITDHVVDVIDPTTFKLVKRIDVGKGPHGVRASRDGRWVYAGVTGTDNIAVIDSRTLKVVKQIPTQGKLPFWISVIGND